METNQPATPSDAGQPSIDDRIAAKFGLADQPEQVEEAPETPVQATDQEVETDEQEVEIPEEETPQPAAEEVLIHNGQEKRVSKEEMRNLAQKGFDYEANMVQNKAERQRLAGIATALEAQQTLQAQVIEHVAEAKAAERQISAFMRREDIAPFVAPNGQVDWIRFSNHDPIAAFQAKQTIDGFLDDRGRALSAAQQTASQKKQAESFVSREFLVQEQEALLKRIPEWKDEAKRNAEAKAILTDLGKQFSPEELKTWEPFLHDHRIIGLLRNGWKYTQALETGKAKKGQLQGLPAAAKPGVRYAPPTTAQSVQQAKSDLRKARSPETKKAATDRMIAAKFGIKL